MSTQRAIKIQEQPVKQQSSLMRILHRVPQFTRMGRHALSIIKHSTLKKIINLIVVEIEYRLRSVNVHGHPYIIIVDPLNVCNLRCPLCPTGTNDLNRKQERMSWEVFTRIIDEMAPYAYEVNLHNWGESLLHPRIFDMIKYINSKNIATNMSTNLNLVKDDKFDKIIESGLEYLILSIDGITQETYSKYRVRGNVERVFENVRKLLKRRIELGSTIPYIEWQFIVFKHNVHEVDAARKMAKEMGIDRFRVIPPGLPFSAKDPEALKKEWFVPKVGEQGNEQGTESFRDRLKTSCFYLYRSFTANPDGGIAPCCVVYGKDNDFGDIKEQGFKEIWNNDKFHSARKLFKQGGIATEPTICDGCTLFKHYGSAVNRMQSEQLSPVTTYSNVNKLTKKLNQNESIKD